MERKLGHFLSVHGKTAQRIGREIIRVNDVKSQLKIITVRKMFVPNKVI